MITMLSRFDLRPGTEFEAFRGEYTAFLELLFAEGLIREAGPLCQRISDTPMDTDISEGPKYYSLMYFHDRAQLDNSYARFKASMRGHGGVLAGVTNATFTCFEEMPGQWMP